MAGQPVAADILKCARKPVDPNDYNGRLDADQLTEIKRIFSGGVCDWSRPGEGQVAVRPWPSYGPAPSRLAPGRKPVNGLSDGPIAIAAAGRPTYHL